MEEKESSFTPASDASWVKRGKKRTERLASDRRRSM